eukprot:CAMPEP_0113695866 /NCGR_PEP_ID=MMETSP0038_2-20120614/21152_1 /TAXON_ID=2898 /ORGANISM="Cryptomonas paramecium" /LENGTH=216 /DNA_ID=CAMNT_0000618485 /DNA_START=66 /DNA_END=716 /DNA_ORIENTATION=- /assembly_acc=CAM_ASM_000170
MSDEIIARLHAVDPRRYVDRSNYTDPSMPEHPAATLLSHVSLRSAQVGSLFGVFVWGPLSWVRSGRTIPLFASAIPRAAGTFFLLGGLAGVGGVVGMAAVGKSPSKVPLHVAGVDDRAFRIAHNPTIKQADDFALAGGFSSLMAARTLTGSGFLGPIGVGVAWATIAQAFVTMGVPEIRKQWPTYRPEVAKFLKEFGIDLPEPPAPPAPAAAGKKK